MDLASVSALSTASLRPLLVIVQVRAVSRSVVVVVCGYNPVRLSPN